MSDIKLRAATSAEWVDTVMGNFDRFLLDHAAAEKKAAGMAISMLSHYPDKPALVEAMADLAVEEMSHYRDVVRLIHQRGGTTGPDAKDPYVIAMRACFRKGSEAYLLDRLLVGGVIEARGAERFGLIGEALKPGQLKRFYTAIARSEERHNDLFVNLAQRYFTADTVTQRLDELLSQEADIVNTLPIRAALH